MIAMVDDGSIFHNINPVAKNTPNKDYRIKKNLRLEDLFFVSDFPSKINTFMKLY